jgi:hypothetical protein
VSGTDCLPAWARRGRHEGPVPGIRTSTAAARDYRYRYNHDSCTSVRLLKVFAQGGLEWGSSHPEACGYPASREAVLRVQPERRLGERMEAGTQRAY